MKTIFKIFALAMVMLGGFLGCQPSTTPASSARKIRFYQCSMHPQVKSDKPGNCTICGMELTPMFEGQSDVNETNIVLSSNSIAVINVQAEAVKRRTLSRSLHVAGTIDDDDTRHRFISAYVDGRIEQLFVNYLGAEVKAGQPMATLYSPNLLAAERDYLVLAARTQTNAMAQISQEHSHLLQASAQRLRRLGLTEDQIAALAQSTNTISETEIMAPISGTVVAKEVYPGKYVKEGEKLFELTDFSVMWFQFDAYEQDLSSLHVGQAVSVTTPSVPGKLYEAKISFIDPNLNEATRSARVRVELANPLVEENGQPHRELLHRLYAEGTVKIEAPDALTVSREAVLNAGGDPLVYVASESGGYEPRAVKLGRRDEQGWEVLTGVVEGEKVVTHGNLLLDAQAQLNRGQIGPDEVLASSLQDKNAHSSDEFARLQEAQVTAVNEFLSLCSAMSDALASDDLAGFNQPAAGLVPALEKLRGQLAKSKGWPGLVEEIARRPLKPADNLAEARRMFVFFSTAASELARELRAREPQWKGLKIYRCPMASQAAPGGPKNGLWIQWQGALRNPFFGSAMLDCGSEVKP